MDDPTKSYVKIYSFGNDGMPDPALVETINITALCDLDNIDISDIAVDAVENIYLTDRRGILVQFSYDGQKAIFGGKWNFTTHLHKVSVHTTPDLVNIIQVVGDEYIIERDLGT